MRSAGAPASEERSPAQRCLVADDEPTTLELLTVALEHAGFAVTGAQDGLEAMRRVREAPPDLALIDVMMPGMDGRDICRAIKDDPDLSGVVVVLHSAADEQDVEWRAAGADGFLQKPFHLRRLVEYLRQRLAAKPKR